MAHTTPPPRSPAAELQKQLKAALCLDFARGYAHPFDTFGPGLEAWITNLAEKLHLPVQVIVSLEANAVARIDASRAVETLIADLKLEGATSIGDIGLYELAQQLEAREATSDDINPQVDAPTQH